MRRMKKKRWICWGNGNRKGKKRKRFVTKLCYHHHHIMIFVGFVVVVVVVSAFHFHFTILYIYKAYIIRLKNKYTKTINTAHREMESKRMEWMATWNPKPIDTGCYSFYVQHNMNANTNTKCLASANESEMKIQFVRWERGAYIYKE